MVKEIIKKNRGFVILFAVTLAALLLSIALGVANIALKEIKFGTSARDTNDAFFAADSGVEKALFNDKTAGFYPTGTSTNLIVSGLGSAGQSCANVTVDKNVSPTVTITAKGYNIGSQDGLCTSTNPNHVEREIKTTYGGSATPPPPPGGFTYHRAITIPASQISNSVPVNFTVLVNATLNAAHVQNSSGYDIVFTSDAGCSTLLNWEMENYNAGNLSAWVKMPFALSNSSDSTFYMCYGKSSVSSFQGGAVGSAWDGNYKGVWHLPNGTSLTANDSTSNGKNGTINGSASAIAGQIDGAGNFNGSTDYISATDNFPMSGSNVTISFWIKPGSHQDWSTIISKGVSTNSGNHDWSVMYNASTNSIYLIRNGGNVSAAGDISGSSWIYFVGTMNTTASNMYFNGTLGNTQGGIGSGNTNNTAGSFINMMRIPGSYTAGRLDEVRVSDTIRSPDWIKTEYNNQSNPSSFCSVGAEQ